MAPLRLAAASWEAQGRGRVVSEARPLSAFNDQPVEQAAAGYDLVAVDHPLIGFAVARGALAPLDDLVAAETLEALAGAAVGASHASYRLHDRQWAVAVDAACQVSAVRDDLLDRPVPAMWAEVADLARARPGEVALPLYPSDAVCSLLTLCANAGTPVTAAGLGREAGPGIALLAELAPLLHPASFASNPPQLLELMRGGNDVAYVPLLFGYRAFATPPLRFADIPSAGGGPVGAVLGGVGFAVPASSGRKRDAADFAAWFGDDHQQRDIVFAAGGQPASRAVWDDPVLDGEAGGFFRATRRTLEAAYVRPREPWWPAFQEAAGQALAAGLAERVPPLALLARLEELFRTHRPGASPSEQEPQEQP